MHKTAISQLIEKLQEERRHPKKYRRGLEGVEVALLPARVTTPGTKPLPVISNIVP
jgi:hypothetical protein